jgi:oxygen-independent coproporphyrinogen-3 oxidase
VSGPSGALNSPYQGYAYAYPHKTAYRALEPAPTLAELWADEDRSALALYAHVPFCAQRCAFCNLFTTATGAVDREQAFLDGLVRQAQVVREALPDARFAIGAIGGGTPTWLGPASLDRVFDVLEHGMGAPLGSMPLSVECSPETVTPEKADLLARRGTTRISLGVQSFVDAEARSVGRTQRAMTVQTALEVLRDARIPTLNVDLIYGLRGQDAASWRTSLEAALEWRPEELYLYPLYVRPLTGLGRHDRSWDDQRLALYRQGRELLLDVGYEQVSMRFFRASHAPRLSNAHRCEADGMVGLGPGARSYTRSVHWSTRFAVGVGAVLEELDGWLAASVDDHLHAGWGFRLDDDERARRYALQGLLLAEGLSRSAFVERFGEEPCVRLPELRALVDEGLFTVDERIRPTAAGLERSDAIGPSLYSASVRAQMESWSLR